MVGDIACSFTASYVYVYTYIFFIYIYNIYTHKGIPWSSSTVPLNAKTRTFFAAIKSLLESIQKESTNTLICNVILWISLLRIIQCTSPHPRLAILTGTVAEAFDDMLHTALLTALLMLCFAGIGTWRFGNSLEEFGTYDRALQTEFEMLFGAIPKNWSNDPQLERELQTFTVLYLMALFLLVLNFVLAIIVESYMKVREVSKKKKFEKDLFGDVGETLMGSACYFVFGWPKRHELGEEIQKWRAKKSVSYKDFAHTGLFKSTKSIMSFMKFYSHFDFLKPPEQVGQVMAYLPGLKEYLPGSLGSEKLTLREQLSVALKIVLERRIHKNKSKDAEKVSKLITSEESLEQSDPFLDVFIVLCDVVGKEIAQSALQQMQDRSIDRDLIKYLNHEGWKLLGVACAIQQAKLVRVFTSPENAHKKLKQVKPVYTVAEAHARIPEVRSASGCEQVQRYRDRNFCFFANLVTRFV